MRLSFAIVSPNQIPVVVDDAFAVDEDQPLTVDTPGVLANDSDADDDPLTATPTRRVRPR